MALLRDSARALTLLLLAAPLASAQDGPDSARTALFAIRSDFETNLNDALIDAGDTRGADSAQVVPDSCLATLAPSVREGWAAALGYYAKVISRTDVFSRQQILLRTDLAGLANAADDDRGREFVRIAAGLRAAAAPAYRACGWPAQQQRNRRWIGSIVERLTQHEAAIVQRLEALYGQQWQQRPIRVDVVGTAGWAGANSMQSLGRGHLLVSPRYQGNEALEIVFHEASHLLMMPGSPLRAALDTAAQAAGVALPRDLWHVVMFFTTGDVVRQSLADAGVAGYQPIVYSIFARGDGWSAFRAPLERHWPAFLSGRATAREAATALLRSLP